MRSCRNCRCALLADPVSCPKCDTTLSKYDIVESTGADESLYSLFVLYHHRFHSEDGTEPLTYQEFRTQDLSSTKFVDYLVSLFGQQHNYAEYLKR